MSELTHIDEEGAPRMVDVGAKAPTKRVAIARTEVLMAPETLAMLARKALPKGDALALARVAGIQAAKRTSDLIPLCHPVALTYADVSFEIDEPGSRIIILAEARAADRTGLEMEALTAAQVAALAIYDMCKAVQKDLVITNCQLMRKTGGKSGDYQAKAP